MITGQTYKRTSKKISDQIGHPVVASVRRTYVIMTSTIKNDVIEFIIYVCDCTKPN